MSRVNIDKILPLVRKPSRYINCEWNSVHKKEKDTLKICLCFPDLYEIGMSNLGMQILYYIINRRSDAVCERVYAPDIDLEKILCNRNIPLFSLESRRPLNKFDILGFSIACELNYTNVLNILTLGQIPLYSRERERGFPLVIAGGFAVCNPEPLADFIDIFVLGEGEEVIGEIIDEVYKAGYNIQDSKEGILSQLSKIKGVYIPSFYKVSYKSNATLLGVFPNRKDIPYKINKRIVNLEKVFSPTHPLVSLMNIIHNRLTLEIQRGCNRGCRFCQAGMIYRPRRERSKDKLIEIAEQCLRNTGYKEISLSSLSSSDYTQIIDLIISLFNKYERERVSISLPSLRSDRFFPVLAKYLQKVKKGGLTFAPEAGSQRLRNIINKGIEEEEIFSAIGYARQYGWRLIKLYFMIGLPFEEGKDIEAITLLVNKIKKKYPTLSLNVSLSFFVPKPHTPFQWVGQAKIEELKRKKMYLSKNLPGQVKTNYVEVSFLEGVFARGDRRLGEVIKEAYFKGCRLDQWKEHFQFIFWQEAFDKTGIDPTFYNQRIREFDELFCWDHLDFGLKKRFLWEEYKKAMRQDLTDDCYNEKCNNCGVCKGIGKKIDQKLKVSDKRREMSITTKENEEGKTLDKIPAERILQKVRIKFKKGEELKYISHLEFVESLRKALRRANLPLVYSEGFNPQIRASFGPALPVGYISDTEFMDLELEEGSSLQEIKNKLSLQLPVGIKMIGIKKIPLRGPSLESLISLAKYTIKMPSAKYRMADEVRKFLSRKQIWIQKKTKSGYKWIDIGQLVSRIDFNNEGEINLTLHHSLSQQIRPGLVIREMFNLDGQEMETLDIKRTELFSSFGKTIF